MIPEDLLYYKEHEWARVEAGDICVVGISQFAQEQLGDVVYVDLPKPGAVFGQFAKFGEIESVKAVSDLYIPVGGEVIAVNPRLADKPELVNQDPYGDGWMLRLKMGDPRDLSTLLTPEQYRQLLEGSR